jgi:membrane-bound metal-dependent hydrolase YbcI (DUF457 family)
MPQAVSFTAFAATQVVVDFEPLYFMLRGEYPIHRLLHTVWGGGTVGLAIGFSLWAVARPRAAAFPSAAGAELGRAPAVLGGLIGGVSHALLDGLMHRDVHALRPLVETQWVLASGGIAALHIGCLLAGALGVALLVVRRVWS